VIAHAPSRRRLLLFGLLVAACAIAAAIAVVSGARSGSGGAPAATGARGILPAAQAHRRPVVVFASRDPRRPAAGGQVAVAALGAAPGRRARTPLRCDRVDYSPAGIGLCLARGHGFAASYRAEVFGPDLRVRHSLGVDGIPSRTRVSADGRLGAVTLFVTGHSYAAAGTFSTATTLIDLSTGAKIAGLESFTVLDGERRVTAVDVNFWGVTFDPHDSDRFYSTLATGGKTYLIRGSVRAREARVIRENVECPSLSPDGTRIVFKKRGGSSARPWRLTELDLATMRETRLAERRSVDDQADWLDAEHVLYGIDGAVWVVRADGRGRPRRYLADASSPAAVRWPAAT
jgi:hypothetical protein